MYNFIIINRIKEELFLKKKCMGLWKALLFKTYHPYNFKKKVSCIILSKVATNPSPMY